jgi:amino acid efflux transporter
MTELRQTLNVWRGTAMLLNIVLGAGLLTLPGLAVQTAGDGAFLIWLACAGAAVPLLIIFAVLGRKYPNSGGLAAILKRAFGDFGYVSATFLFLGAVIFGLPAIALTGGHYAAAMLGLSPHLLAVLLLVAAVGVNLISAERAAQINTALASVLLVILVMIAVVGWEITKPDIGALIPEPIDFPDRKLFLAGFMMVFFAFTGWEVGANLSGEFKNPNRNVPLAIFLSFAIAVGLYGVLAAVVQSANLSGLYEAPFAALFGQE